MVIVLTDGKSNDDVTAPAQKLRDSGVIIFALGVGSGIDRNQLNTIATDPDAKHTFVVNNFDALNSIIKTVKERACQGVYVLLHF